MILGASFGFSSGAVCLIGYFLCWKFIFRIFNPGMISSLLATILSGITCSAILTIPHWTYSSPVAEDSLKQATTLRDFKRV